MLTFYALICETASFKYTIQITREINPAMVAEWLTACVKFK